jgi:hypothetical protein
MQREAIEVRGGEAAAEAAKAGEEKGGRNVAA